MLSGRSPPSRKGRGEEDGKKQKKNKERLARDLVYEMYGYSWREIPRRIIKALTESSLSLPLFVRFYGTPMGGELMEFETRKPRFTSDTVHRSINMEEEREWGLGRRGGGVRYEIYNIPCGGYKFKACYASISESANGRV